MGIIIKKKKENKILLGFLVSSILFWIYISEVFNKVSETSPLVTSFYFIDDSDFITLGSLVKEIINVFEKVAKEIIK